MTPRTLILTAGIAAAGYWLSKQMSSVPSLPQSDGLMPDADTDDGPALASELQDDRPALEAGMPADMSNDADRVRPGFADYARGA